MTDKEASIILRALWAYKEPRYIEKEIREALSLAIKALETIDLVKFNIHALNELVKEAENE